MWRISCGTGEGSSRAGGKFVPAPPNHPLQTPLWDLAQCWAQHPKLRMELRAPGISLGSSVLVPSGPPNPPTTFSQARKKRNPETFHLREVQACPMRLQHWHGHPLPYGTAPAPRAPSTPHLSQEMPFCLLVASSSSYKPRHRGTRVGVCRAAEVWRLRAPPASPPHGPQAQRRACPPQGPQRACLSYQLQSHLLLQQRHACLLCLCRLPPAMDTMGFWAVRRDLSWHGDSPRLANVEPGCWGWHQAPLAGKQCTDPPPTLSRPRPGGHGGEPGSSSEVCRAACRSPQLLRDVWSPLGEDKGLSRAAWRSRQEPER